MAKPLPSGCIKDDKDISWETINFLLESVSFEDKIGHLYIVDIEFKVKSATKREFAYNEIYPPIIEQQKTIYPCERSVFQLLEQLVNGDRVPNLFKQNFMPMYLEDLIFCIKRVGSKVTKIHSHLTFEQARFKQNFILMNQKSRQKSKDSVEKDFFKLMNNSNFGYNSKTILTTANWFQFLTNIKK